MSPSLYYWATEAYGRKCLIVILRKLFRSFAVARDTNKEVLTTSLENRDGFEPPYGGLQPPASPLGHRLIWCRVKDLNLRRLDLQSNALPAELTRQDGGQFKVMPSTEIKMP